MRTFGTALAVLALLFASTTLAFNRRAVQRDAQAATLMQSCLAAMGSANPPSDSQASGTIAITAGSQNDSGTITVLTLGSGQTSEQISATYTNQTLIYSSGVANQDVGANVTVLPLELSVASQAADFPLALLLGEFSNSDWALQYIGAETLNGAAVQHLRLWNTYASDPTLAYLSSFTTQDLWLDAASYLPQELSYNLQAGSGSCDPYNPYCVGVPAISVQVFYSNFTNQAGVLYPLQISKSLNGTPWATITIQSVAFNVGLTPANFPIQLTPTPLGQ